jgi:hypothetical protein
MLYTSGIIYIKYNPGKLFRPSELVIIYIYILEVIMSFSEFKNRVNLIISFVTKVNEEDIPNEIKRILVKVYANTLRINLSDRMADSIIANTLPLISM